MYLNILQKKVANKQEVNLTSLVIKEFKVTFTKRYHYTRMSDKKKEEEELKITNIGEAIEWLDLMYSATGNVN